MKKTKKKEKEKEKINKGRGGVGFGGVVTPSPPPPPPKNLKLVWGWGDGVTLPPPPNWKLVWGLGLPPSPPSSPLRVGSFFPLFSFFVIFQKIWGFEFGRGVTTPPPNPNPSAASSHGSRPLGLAADETQKLWASRQLWKARIFHRPRGEEALAAAL